jgi:uncharacterized protein (TIGR00290 family)
MTTATPVLLAWSGGKDCLMALQALQADPAWHPVALLTTVTRTFDRVAMHGIRRDVLKAQAQSLGLPLLTAEIDWPSSNQDYEAAQSDALAVATERWPGLHHCAFGDLFLEDIRRYREEYLSRMGWQGVFPIWHADTSALARRFVQEGHRAVLTCVDTTQLGAGFCGRTFDRTLLEDLPDTVDPCGENGEFHTLAYDGPAFHSALALRAGAPVLREGRFQYADFLLDDAP